jgi:ubiquinone/menaquinone biosynthesis C-methylase UbiE
MSMPDLRRRSYQPEIMDLEPVSDADTGVVLSELGFLNRWLGGVSSSLDAIRGEMARLSGPVTVLDVGAGGADLTRALLRGRDSGGKNVRVIALDLSPVTCRVARARMKPGCSIDFVAADGCCIPLADGSVDIAHSAMMFHHFTEPGILALLAELRRVTRFAVVINDLHRHPLAYHGVTVLTRLLSRSRYVRHDGPLSVARGFRREDIARTWSQAGLTNTEIRWRWAFRWVAISRFATPGSPLA